MTEIADATVVDDEPGTDLVPAPQQSATLFHTDDPVEVVEKASRVADALKSVLKRQGLTSTIQGKDHVLVEGWTTLGSMLGVVPVVVWTRKLDKGWEARVEARTLDGRTVGAAEAECLRDERRWSKADDYALRSMAQTRAISKALRGPLGFVVTLAGFAATPADEMPADNEPAVPPAELIGKDRVAVLCQSIADALGAGIPADALPDLFHKAGANPSRIDAEAVEQLTEPQATALERLLNDAITEAAA